LYTLQPVLCALTGLTKLDLGANRLTVPSAVPALEPLLCALTGLKTLTLSGNDAALEQDLVHVLTNMNAEFGAMGTEQLAAGPSAHAG
jgi:hypothetical protein